MAKSKNYTMIAHLCDMAGFKDPKQVYKKSKIMFDDYRIAAIYADQVTEAIKTPEEIEAEKRELRFELLDLFWRPFEDYKVQMSSLVDKAMSKVWFKGLVDDATTMMLMVNKGDDYKKILDNYYFHAKYESKTDRMLDCGFNSKSVFYDRLEEAVTLFGLEAWIHLKNNEYRDIAKGIVPNHPIFPDITQ